MTFLELFRVSEKTKLKAVNERLDNLESQIRLLRMEWAEVYDKTTHAIERWTKREKFQKPTEPEKITPSEIPSPTRIYSDLELMELARKQGMVG